MKSWHVIFAVVLKCKNVIWQILIMLLIWLQDRAGCLWDSMCRSSSMVNIAVKTFMISAMCELWC